MAVDLVWLPELNIISSCDLSTPCSRRPSRRITWPRNSRLGDGLPELGFCPSKRPIARFNREPSCPADPRNGIGSCLPIKNRDVTNNLTNRYAELRHCRVYLHETQSSQLMAIKAPSAKQFLESIYGLAQNPIEWVQYLILKWAIELSCAMYKYPPSPANYKFK